jgi:hypothetical protein
MSNKLSPVGAKAIAAEVADVELGDERLNKRFVEVMAALAGAPSASFAEMCPSPDALEALYRFMRNPNVDWRDVLAPHAEQCVERAKAAKRVIVVHDSSKVRVAEDADLQSYLNTGKKGFLAHVALVLDANEQRKPLGVVGLELLMRKSRQARTRRAGRAMSGFETSRLKNKAYDRWRRLVDLSAEMLTDVDVVHVMDREADSYALLAHMVANGQKFVVRWCRDRRARSAESEPSGDWEYISQLVEGAPSTRLVREVRVSKRSAHQAPNAARRSPGRQQRTARLRFARCSVVVRKPYWVPDSSPLPKELSLNVVRVYEPDPPKGVEPIEWVLLTNLPIERVQDVEAVVDLYRQRWLIEEFFKALKTGCAYRKRRLTNRQSIFNTLVSFIPVAWKALALRQLAQRATASASDVLDATELTVLLAKAKRMSWKLSAQPTAKEALRIIARIGGHRDSSGPPGWSALMKGTDRFLGLVEGWTMREAKM